MQQGPNIGFSTVHHRLSRRNFNTLATKGLAEDQEIGGPLETFIAREVNGGCTDAV